MFINSLRKFLSCKDANAISITFAPKKRQDEIGIDYIFDRSAGSQMATAILVQEPYSPGGG